MKKLLIKWLMPKPASLAKMAAKSAQEFVNSTGKAEAIASFVQKSKAIGDAQMLVMKWLEDGKVSDGEAEELEKALVPLFQTVYDRVVGKEGQA